MGAWWLTLGVAGFAWVCQVAEFLTSRASLPELLSYCFDVGDALRMCHHVNATIAAMVNSAPDHFYGLGMVPMQDPLLAAREMARLKADYGLLGIEVSTNINGKPIGDTRASPRRPPAGTEFERQPSCPAAI